MQYIQIPVGIKLLWQDRSLHVPQLHTMQDGAKAIYNAVQDILDPEIVANCWFHVKQSLRKRKGDFQDPNNYT
jgi:hypothetical protein